MCVLLIGALTNTKPECKDDIDPDISKPMTTQNCEVVWVGHERKQEFQEHHKKVELK